MSKRYLELEFLDHPAKIWDKEVSTQGTERIILQDLSYFCNQELLNTCENPVGKIIGFNTSTYSELSNKLADQQKLIT